MHNLFETDNFQVTNSPLSQNVTKDGQTIRVDIYKGEDEGWFLEIVDVDQNSTVWDETFDTEQLALDMAISAIDEKGIFTFIDPDNQA